MNDPIHGSACVILLYNPPMYLPRWLMVSMLTACALATIALARWWITWPEKTARQFFQFARDKNLDACESMISPAYDEDVAILNHFKLFATAERPSEQNAPSLLDVIRGRRVYRVF